MEKNLQFSIVDLVAAPVSPSYFSSVDELVVDVQSVEAAASGSGESDVEVIACYRQVPLNPQTTIAGRKMTTDLSGCTESEFLDIPWVDFEKILQTTEQVDPLDRRAGLCGASITGSPLIRHCGKLHSQVHAPLSPPACDKPTTYRGETY